VIGLLARIDARRPASWIAALAAAAAVVVLASRPTTPWVALACGGLLAVAALGDPCHLAALPELAVPRAVARASWPAVGAVAGLLAASCLGGDVRRSAAAAAPVAGGLAAVLAVVAVAARRGRHGWPRMAGGMFDPWGPDDAGRRGWLDAAALASTLVAMAVCYFLAPQLSGWYAVVAATWFVVLTVPRAIIGAADAAGRIALVGAAVGRPCPPGVPAHAVRTLVAGAAILGWPAVVAAVLGPGPARSADGPLTALAILAALVIVAAVAVRCRRRPDDTPLAAAAVGLVAVLIGLAQSP
jgi:hypothetical protein